MSELTKKKEDSLITRQKLIDAAFDNFFEIGFENTSLEKISKDAHVSRGAAYWHFKNKQDLFRETVLEILRRMAERKQPIYEDKKMTFEEKAVRMIAIPYKDSINYKFIQRASKTIERNEEFSDLMEEVQGIKSRLYRFFLEGVQSQKRKNIPESEVSSEAIASLLYTYFEGMHVSVVPEDVVRNYSMETIRKNVMLILNQL